MFVLSEEQEQRARRLHAESLVVDSQMGGATLFAAYPPGVLERAIGLLKRVTAPWIVREEAERMQTEELISGRSDIEREWMELSGVDVFVVTASMYMGRSPFERALAGLALWQRKFDSLDYLVKATSFKDIGLAKAHGKKSNNSRFPG